MDVSASTLRADLSSWLDRVSSGEEVVVTDRGVPVARLVPVHSAALIQQLVADGVIGRAGSNARPVARGAARVVPTSPVSDLVAELRR